MKMAEGTNVKADTGGHGNGAVDTSIGQQSSWLLWLLPRVVTAIYFCILFVWIYKAEGGIGTNDSNIFGLHALFMSLFILIFVQEAILAFSWPRTHYGAHKYMHTVFHILGLGCFIGGLVTISKYKRLSTHPIVYPFYTLYSPHSWVGVLLLCLWAIQLFAGILIHGTTKNYAADLKGKLSGYHRFLGLFIYGVGLATCAMGFQDMQGSDLAGSTMPADVGSTAMIGYLPHSRLANYASATCLLLVFIGLLTFSRVRSVLSRPITPDLLFTGPVSA